MSILESIEGARKRSAPESRSEKAWWGLSDSEREAVVSAIASGDVGHGKMSDVLKSNGVDISKHFLRTAIGRESS